MAGQRGRWLTPGITDWMIDKCSGHVCGWNDVGGDGVLPVCVRENRCLCVLSGVWTYVWVHVFVRVHSRMCASTRLSFYETHLELFLQELSGNVTHPLAAMLEFCLMKYQYWMPAVHLSRMENDFLWFYLRNGATFLGNSAICCLATRLGYNSFVCMLNRTDHNVGKSLLTYNLI